MTKEELERIKFVANKYLEMVDSLSDKKLDFSQVNFDDDVMKYILGYRWNLENQKIKREQSIQVDILNECMSKLKKQYPDFYCIEYQTKIRDYRNYYLVQIYGSPFTRTDFIFDKEANFVMEWPYSNGSIDVIDENNFFVVKRDNFGNKESAIHFCVMDNRVMIIQAFHNVRSNILPVFGENLDVEFGNLVSWRCFTDSVVHEGKSVLYNYKYSNIVVPEFTDAKYDYGNFSRILRDDLIRVINRIEHEDNYVELEFLIDEDGNLATDVMDFQNDIRYSIDNRGTDQVWILDSIFYEVNEGLIKSRCTKGKGRTKR